MNIGLTFFNELKILLRVNNDVTEQKEKIQFYIHRFQCKALMVSNILTFLLYCSFLPYIIFSLRNYDYQIPQWMYIISMSVAFGMLFILAFEFHKRYANKKFDVQFKRLLFLNVGLIIVVNYFSAYILNHNNLNFYLMVFSIAYINVFMVLTTQQRLYFTLINCLCLVSGYLHFKPVIRENEVFQISLIILLNLFFMILGQIFYKIYLITLKKHLAQKKNLIQINQQKDLIEKVLIKQQESIRQLHASLNTETDVQKIIENPLILSNTINNLIHELNDSKERLKNSKEKYKDIFENVSDGIMIRNKNLEITICNPMVEEITGFNMKEEGTNKLEHLVKSDFKEAYQQYIEKLKRNEESEFKGEITTNRGIGDTVIEVFSTPVLQNGVFDGSRDIIRKVTKEQQKMIKAYEKHEAERLFLLNLNHEIRTPLNSIIGLSHILKTSDFPESEREMVDIVYHSSVYLKNLVSDILELSNLETGHYLIQEKVHPFYQENLKIIQNFQYLATEKNLDLQFICPILYNDNFKFDLVLYTKLINNLISNAFKFTEKGYIKLEIGKDLIEKEDRTFVEIQVEDSGIGIEEENITTVFDKFKQFNMSQPNGNQGIGLGLSICKEIITQLNGNITLSSEIGKGSRFTFQFPISPVTTFKQI